ncbi:hypothetical protein GCM10007242_10980 [Pigmentiphaga litoralis]|uniref:DUF2231 domain-containing protein n=1 Tax=Pigmentiphaga litoralis TaxID=516702 RepID=UPI0016771984|nr:DUF2231 domain-containing protein [Pigmentiphaga litoralis]GGX07354.1 hypothetical protein GCM10007242_10980 [Pigmentiphaga litoralis]
MEKFGLPLPIDTPTRVAVAEHPIHPMLVPFPIAFFLGGLAADGAFIFLGDPFWARASLWLIGAGAVMGILAGIAGTIELLSVPGIRHRAASWNHFVVAVLLLGVGSINWYLRLGDAEAAVVPYGVFLSCMGALLVAVAGWMGGKLVFEHQIGVGNDDTDD